MAVRLVVIVHSKAVSQTAHQEVIVEGSGVGLVGEAAEEDSSEFHS